MNNVTLTDEQVYTDLGEMFRIAYLKPCEKCANNDKDNIVSFNCGYLCDKNHSLYKEKLKEK